MLRSMHIAMAALVIAIGFTVGSLAWRAASAPDRQHDLNAADPAIGYAFYQALDRVLASGDRSALDRVVAGGFIDHAGEQEQSTGELVDQLSSLRASFPEMSLQVRDIEPSADSLVAWIAPVQMTGTVASDLRFTMGPVPGGYEVLRVHGGRVTDRWSSTMPAAELTSFDDAEFDSVAAFGQTIRLESITLPANGTVTWRDMGDRVVLVETGTVQLDARWIGSEGEVMHSAESRAAGQALLSPAGRTVTVRAGSDAPASVLVMLVTLRKVDLADTTLQELGPDASLAILWQSSLPVVAGGSWHLAVGHVALPAGVTSTLRADGKSDLLLAAAGDSASLSIEGGQVARQGQDPVPGTPGTGAVLEPGAAALVTDSTSIGIASLGDEPAVLWLVEIQANAPLVTPAPSKATPATVIRRGLGFSEDH